MGSHVKIIFMTVYLISVQHTEPLLLFVADQARWHTNST